MNFNRNFIENYTFYFQYSKKDFKIYQNFFQHLIKLFKKIFEPTTCGVFESAIVLSGWSILTLYGTLNLGSSKHGLEIKQNFIFYLKKINSNIKTGLLSFTGIQRLKF